MVNVEEYKKIVVMKLGKTLNGVFYPKNKKWKFPKECPVNIDFDENRMIGLARNFRQIKNTIVCDILLNRPIRDTIMPKITNIIKKIKRADVATKIKLVDLSLMYNPSDKSLKGNILCKKKA